MKNFIPLLWLVITLAVTSKAATFTVTVPATNTLTSNKLPRASSGAQLGGDSAAFHVSSTVLGLPTFTEGYEALTPGANVTLNWLTGRSKSITLAQNTTFAFSNTPSATTNIQRMVVRVVGDGVFTVAFTGALWQTAQVATPPASVITIYLFEAQNSNVYGYTFTGGPTINPTDGFVPYRVDASSFGDSPWYRISTNKMGFTLTNVFLWNENDNVGTSQALAIGSDSLTSVTSSGGWGRATGLGYGTFREALNAGESTAVGWEAGAYSTNITGSTLVGVSTGGADSIDRMTAVGTGAGQTTGTSVDDTAIGYIAGSVLGGSTNTVIGSGVAQGIVNTTSLTAVGKQAGSYFPNTNNRIRSFDTFLGTLAGTTTTDANITNAIAIGFASAITNSNEIIIGNTSNTKAIFPIPSNDGSGTHFLSDDGTYKVAGSSALWTLNGDTLEPSPAVGLVNITSTLADNATNVALIVDTAAPWATRSSVFETRNDGTNIFKSLAPYGNLVAGAHTEDIFGTYGGQMFSFFYDHSKGDPSNYEFSFGSTSGDTNSSKYGVIDFYGTPKGSALEVGAFGSGYTFTRIDTDNDITAHANDHTSIDGRVNGLWVFWLDPNKTYHSESPYSFRTKTTLSSGTHTSFVNNETNIWRLDYEGTANTIHLAGLSSSPTIATNSGAGLSGASASIAGSDLAGEITINSGLTPAVNTAICTVTFANTYSPTVPYVVISPTETNASTLGFVPFVTRTTTTFVLTNPTAQALAGSTTYKYAYVCVQ